jgi:hypothetical protein
MRVGGVMRVARVERVTCGWVRGSAVCVMSLCACGAVCVVSLCACGAVCVVSLCESACGG